MVDACTSPAAQQKILVALRSRAAQVGHSTRPPAIAAVLRVLLRILT